MQCEELKKADTFFLSCKWFVANRLLHFMWEMFEILKQLLENFVFFCKKMCNESEIDENNNMWTKIKKDNTISNSLQAIVVI